MKGYIGRLALLAGIFVAFNAVLVLWMHAERPQRAWSAWYLRLQEITRETPSPRIVLIGGSGTAIGVQNDSLAAAFGLPVVNLGLHAGLGVRFQIDDARRALRRGDIVIISPEYENFYNVFDGGIALLRLCIESPEALRSIRSMSQVQHMAAAVPHAVQRWLAWKMIEEKRATTTRGAQRRRIVAGSRWENDIAAMCADRERPSGKLEDTEVFQPERIDNRAIRVLAADIAALRDSCTVVLFWPSIPDTYYASWKATLDTVQRRMTAATGSPIIPPEAWTLPVGNFGDTFYHPDSIGRLLRTRLMIDRLAPYILPCGQREKGYSHGMAGASNSGH